MMFHPNGRWKEFGVGDVETTVFPFWMFCIFWAIVCYSLSLLFVDTSKVAVVSASNISPDNSVSPLGVSGPKLPGYYKLNGNASKKGVPRYIYVGTEIPEDLDS
jgi:hypothetical protein